MFEDFVSFCVGMGVAYLLVKTIRSFRTLSMAIMCYMIVNVEANHSLLCSNASPNQIHCRWDRPDGNNVWNMNLAAGANSGDYVSGSDGVNITLRIYYPTYPTLVASYSQTATNLIYTYVYSGPAEQYTNYSGCISLTNTTDSPKLYSLSIFRLTDNAIMRNSMVNLPMKGDSYYECLELPYPWWWDAKEMFEESPGIVKGTNDTPGISTNSPPPIPPGPPVPTPNTNDPIGEITRPINPSTTNEIVADRQNTLAILAELQRLRQELKRGQGEGLSPHDLTNYLGTDWLTLSNQVWNQNASSWASSGMQGITNNMGAWATNCGNPSGNPLRISAGYFAGHEYVVDMNPANGIELSQRWVTAGNLISNWIAWSIVALLFWLCMWRVDSLLGEVLLGAATSTKPSGSSNSDGPPLVPTLMTRKIMGWGLRAASAFVFAVVIISIIGTLPTALVAWMNGYGVTNPYTLSGVFESITSFSDIGLKNVMVAYIKVLEKFIPFNVLISFGFTWLLFFMFSRAITMATAAILRALGWVVPCVLLMVFTISSEAQCVVEVQNMTGSNVVASNGNYVLHFPPGLLQIVLEPSTWQVGSNSFEVPGAEKMVLAIGANTNGVPVLSIATGWSSLEWGLTGFYTGFGVFAFGWLVAEMRQGLRLYER